MASRPLGDRPKEQLGRVQNGLEKNVNTGRDQYGGFMELVALAAKVSDADLRDQMIAKILSVAEATGTASQRGMYMWQVCIFMRAQNLAAADDVLMDWHKWGTGARGRRRHAAGAGGARQRGTEGVGDANDADLTQTHCAFASPHSHLVGRRQAQ